MDFKNLTFITDAYSPKHIEETEKFLFLNRLKKRVRYVLKIMNYILLIGVGFFFVYPFAWMASMSLRPLIEALSFSPRLIVDNPQWSNYLYAWNQAQISHYVGNSIKYSLLVMGLQYLAIIPAAYAFATMEFKGKKFLWATKYLGMMLPGEATLIPVYFFYSKMGLVDTWGGLILPSLFNVWHLYVYERLPAGSAGDYRVGKNGQGQKPDHHAENHAAHGCACAGYAPDYFIYK